MPRLVAALLAISLALPLHAACTATWTGVAANGQWSDAGNWSPPSVPDAADDVCITTPGTYVVTASLGTTSFQSLMLGAGSGAQTLALNGGNVTFANITTNAGSTLQLTGAQLTGTTALNIAGAVTVDASSTFDLGGETSIASTGTVSGAGSIQFHGAAVNNGTIYSTGTIALHQAFSNASGATFTSTGTFTPDPVFHYGGSGTMNLNGTSTLRGYWLGPGTTSIGPSGVATIDDSGFMMNSRTLHVDGNLTTLSGISAYQGTIEVASGGVFHLPLSVAVDASVTGAGRVEIPAGSAPGFSATTFTPAVLDVGGSPFWTNFNPNPGTINLQGGSMRYPNAASYVFMNGQINGTGAFHCSACQFVLNGGLAQTLNPGGTNAIGSITFYHPVLIDRSIDLEIASANDYDVVQVVGEISDYDGTNWAMNVSMIGGYAPPPGTQFVPLYFGSGDISPLLNAAGFAATFNATNVLLTKITGILPRSDFDQDGSNDLVLRNYATGANAAWLMNGTTFVGVSDLPGIGTNFTIAGTADFDADGHPDILLRQDTGRVVAWRMSGPTVIGLFDFPAMPDGTQEITSTGDFDGDQRADLVIRNSSTLANSLLLNRAAGFTTVPLPALPNADYHIVGAGDFNGDDKYDIVWRNVATGANAVWLMNGSSFLGIADLPALPNTNYRIEGVGDMDGDGDGDIVLRNYVTGANAIWVMSGTTLDSIADLPALVNVDQHIVGPQ